MESPNAHMHVGWAAVLDPPQGREPPGFTELAEHIRSRLPRAPRYRQMLRSVPLGLNSPVWVDDPGFDLSRHLVDAGSGDLVEVVDTCMSEPLARDRPLWQMWIASPLDDGRVALVAKAHHCMVDGIAAVQLGSLLLDPTPEPPPPERDEWTPAPSPSPRDLLLRGAVDLLRDQLTLASLPLRVAGTPRRALDFAARSRRALGALADSVRPAPVSPALNPPISPRRHLGSVTRPIEDLRRIKAALEVTLNDVVLAVATTAVRRLLAERGDRPGALKAMIPVNVRSEADDDALGNRISFMFIDLPCEEPDPIRRVRELHAETDDCKRRQTAEGGDDVLSLLSHVPSPARRVISRLMASPRAFNLVVSNIPGPPEAMYMRGCRLREAFPVVPLADGHALSVGFTSVADQACFGLYADPAALPDVDDLSRYIEVAIDELLEIATRERPREPAFA